MSSSHQTAIASAPRALAREAAATTTSSGAVSFATIVSLVAAVINLRVTPENFATWWGYGAVYLLGGVAGLALVGLLQRRPSGCVLQAGIWTNLAMLLMFLVARTSGLPFGPGAGSVSDLDVLGTVAALSEAGLVLVLCGLLSSRARRRTLNLLALVGVSLWAAAATGALSPSEQAVNQRQHPLRNHFTKYKFGEGPLPVIPNSIRNGKRPFGDG